MFVVSAYQSIYRGSIMTISELGITVEYVNHIKTSFDSLSDVFQELSQLTMTELCQFTVENFDTENEEQLTKNEMLIVRNAFEYLINKASVFKRNYDNLCNDTFYRTFDLD
jgi:hypothetical protein